MRILGITSGSESGVAAFEDDRLCSAVSEERLSRIKFDHGFPERALDWTLEFLGWQASEIDLICYGFSNGLRGGEFFSEMMARLGEYASSGADVELICARLVTEERIDRAKRSDFNNEVERRFPGVPVHRCGHHRAHQSAAYANSPFNTALVMTIDGRGDFESMTIAEGRGTQLTQLHHAFSWESLGYFYGRVTELCGFVPNRHEGKVTGLAALGDPGPARSLMRDMIELREGKLTSHPGIWYRPFFTQYSDELRARASDFSREDLAAAAQAHLEELVVALIRPYLGAHAVGNLCLAGGVFANVKLNQRLRELPEVDDVFVYPAMSDGGICAGVVHEYHLGCGVRARQERTQSVYQGPTIDPQRLRRDLLAHGYQIEEPDDLAGSVARDLADGQLVGLVQGRCEFGPRALGNRSILAAPHDASVCGRINARLRRSEFMPFAPVMASEFADQCLVDYAANDASAAHMTMAYDVTEAMKTGSPAVVHADGTARPQVVRAGDNLVLHQILHSHHARDGGLCLLNTSFNAHEEPILGTEPDVLQAALRGDVDILCFPPYLAKCRNPEQQ